MSSAKSYGFGVDPVRSAHHFFVVLPNLVGNTQVRVFERFHWSSGKKNGMNRRDAELGPDLAPVYKHGQQIEGSDILRLELAPAKWDKVAKAVSSEFNARLRKTNQPSGRFVAGGVAVAEDLGKELMVLLWSIRDADPGQVHLAIENWLGFRPEERRWLYTMTNARHGGLDDRQGWRMALREILCTDLENRTSSNPVSDAEHDGMDGPVLNGDRPKGTRTVRSCNKKPFGPVEENGFYLVLPRSDENFFPYVYESSVDRALVHFPLYQWKAVVHDVEEVFNLRLGEDNLPKGRFSPGVNALSRLLGKELLILLWTLEQVSKSSASTVLRNWKSLMPEERWWLYARTAATPKSWKRALRAALGECGPMMVQGGLF